MAAGDGVAGDALERQLFGRAGVAQGQRRRIEPECPPWRARLKRPGVTMTIFSGRNTERSVPRATATAASAICCMDSNRG